MTIPASVECIDGRAFRGCKRLRHVTFAPGSRLEKIGAECFQNTGIERITIPKGVTKIQTRTFYNCKKLVEVAFEAGSRL